MEQNCYRLYTTQTQVLLFWNSMHRSSLISKWRSGQPKGPTLNGHVVEIESVA